MALKLRFLDFETYYADDYTLSRMPSEEYIRDPRFQTIGFSIRTDIADERGVWVSGSDEYMADKLRSLDWKNTIITGHNMSEFDSLILSHHYGIAPKFYQCTLQMARAIHGKDVSKSLAALCKKYGLPDKGIEVHAARGKRREDFTPAELAAYGNYCIGDSDRCRELYHILRRELPASELQVSHLFTRMFADARLQLDGELLSEMLADIKRNNALSLDYAADMMGVAQAPTQELRRLAARTALRSDAQFAKLLDEGFGITPPTKLSPKRKNPDGSPLEVYAFAKTDEAMQDMAADDDDEELQAIVAARLGAKSTQAESRMERLVGIAHRGPLPVPLVYGKTHTHRAAGGGKINLQNLPRVKGVGDEVRIGTLIHTPSGYGRVKRVNALKRLVMLDDGTIHPMKECRVAGLRDAITAPEGKVLVVADSSNIELRVCHLLAGQMDTVEKLRSGIDLYCDFAQDIYGYAIDKKVHIRERQHGKVGHLQLQFQSGGASFRRAARNTGGIKLTQEESDITVQVYRKKHSAIRKFWNTAERSIGDIFNGNHRFIDQWGLCRVEKDKVVLPNGMPLNYFNLRRHTFENDEKQEEKWVYDDKETRKMKVLYGGCLTENLVQALARNAVFDQMLEVEKRWGTPGNGVVLTVHDEVVALVDEDDADECLKFMLAQMAQSPKWWPTLPLAAEGGIGVRYADAK